MNTYKKNKINPVVIAMSVWLFFMMALPGVHILFRLTLLIFFVFIYIVSNRGRIRGGQTVWEMLFVWLIFFAFTFLNSIENGFGMEFSMLEIYIIRPVVYAILSGVFILSVKLEKIADCLIYISLFVSLYNWAFFLQIMGLIPQIIHEDIWFGVKNIVIVGNKFYTFRTSNQTSLMFLSPLMIFMLANSGKLEKGKRRIIRISAMLTIAISMICGRRILQLITVMFLLLVFVYRLKEAKIGRINSGRMIEKIFVATIVILAMFWLINGFQFNVISASIATLKESLANTSEGLNTRWIQFQALTDMWAERPLFGWGISATNLEYDAYRHVDEMKNFSYELFYIGLLLKIGMMGMGLVVAYGFIIFKKMAAFYQRNKNNFEGVFVGGVIAGYVGFLICGATNPLVTSSWMWFIVISVSFYCSYMIEKERIHIIAKNGLHRNCCIQPGCHGNSIKCKKNSK